MMNSHGTWILAAGFVLLSVAPAIAAGSKTSVPPPPPAAARRPVVDAYHGKSVTDDYRWLESGADPAVQRWSESENRYARSVLDHLPGVAALRRRITDLESFPSPSFGSLVARGGMLFAMKDEPPKQQAFLVALRSPDDPASARAIVDPNALDPKGTTAIDFFVPSLDGKLVVVSLSRGGSESGDAHVFETATGKALPDVIPRVNGGTAGGSVAWNADGTGFYYTRYPRGKERPLEDLDFFQQVWFHKLGTPVERDTYSLGREFPRIAETFLRSSDDGRFVLAIVENGDGGEFALYFRGPSGAWSRIADAPDQVVAANFGPEGTLFLLSRNGAPRGKILRLAPGVTTLAGAATVVPEGREVILGFEPAASLLYVTVMDGGPAGIRVFDEGGKERAPVPVPPVSSVGQLVRLGGDRVLFSSETYLEPQAWYRYDPSDGKPAKTALRRASIADFGDCEVVKETATSKDGTAVPVFIVQRRSAPRDGSNPTLLTGYGGFGISMAPYFSDSRRAFVEQGGVWAIAILRGGGEFGEEWHRAGNLTRKQNVFDDFAAAAERLIEARVTSPAKLAIEGGSNGGLLMGAALTQHPALFKAVVAHVGIYDMLRVETTPNGAFNVTEYGTVKDRAQFDALFAYSPYHHVADGSRYPDVLFLTGANDPRVDPFHSRKMTARLRAATGGRSRVLLRTSADTGHGIGSSLDATIAETVDVYAFVFDELGVPYRPVAKPAK
jgi:prolyl oligopeptidase